MDNHRTIHQLHVFISTCIYLSTFIIFLVGFLLIGPIAEEKYLPVIEDVIAVQVNIPEEPKALVFKIIGDKERECEFLSMSAIVKVKDEYVPAELIPVSNIPMASTPRGMQVLGIIQVIPAGSKVKVSTSHRCHFLWDTHAEFEWLST